jgi:hypothetical protein
MRWLLLLLMEFALLRELALVELWWLMILV